MHILYYLLIKMLDEYDYVCSQHCALLKLFLSAVLLLRILLLASTIISIRSWSRIQTFSILELCNNHTFLFRFLIFDFNNFERWVLHNWWLVEYTTDPLTSYFYQFFWIIMLYTLITVFKFFWWSIIIVQCLNNLMIFLLRILIDWWYYLCLCMYTIKFFTLNRSTYLLNIFIIVYNLIKLIILFFLSNLLYPILLCLRKPYCFIRIPLNLYYWLLNQFIFY